MTEYIVEIHDPAEIEQVVAATLERAREQDLTIVLDHKEDPCTVRGYSEPLLYDPDSDIEPVYSDGKEQPGEVVRREDGGLTFYHNNTVCYMEAGPVDPGESKSAATIQSDWGERVQELLAEVDDRETYWEAADIYTGDDSQLAGTSVRTGSGVVARRACIYDSDPLDPDDPDTRAFSRLLEADGIDPDDYRAAVAVPEDSLLGWLEDELDAERITAQEFIAPYEEAVRERFSAVQERDGGRIRGSCVLSDYSCLLED